MAYIDRINGLIEQTILKNTTSKILQHMGRIRNASSINQARRWVMELIQNARDVSLEDGIRICITETDDELIFAHTGKPFRVKDVLSIINQASSKDDSIEAVGKFGTGFVTTFQLSESVTLESVLLDDGEDPLPFKIVLDRSGRNDVEIQKSIEDSMEQLKDCVLHPREFQYNEDDYNTKFIYNLPGDYEKKIARTGIVDLKNTVNEILLFSDKIKEILVIIDTDEEKKCTSYKVGETIELNQEQNIYSRDFCWVIRDEMSGTKNTETHHLIYKKDELLTICLSADEEQNIIEIDENKARLFIDFPLIGSEKFPFPVVINDRELYPNEPRSGITLVDSERSDEASWNKQIITRAVSMYEVLLNYLVNSNYKRIWNIVRIPAWQENAELSEQWVENEIYNHLFAIIARVDIVETDRGMTSLDNPRLRIVDAQSQNEREDVYWLITNQNKYYTAKCSVDWREILQGYNCNSSRLKKIGLSNILGSINIIINEFSDDEKAMNWLCQLYKASMKVEKYAAEIQSSYVQIYPVQRPNSFSNKNGKRVIYHHKHVLADKINDELLRSVAEYFFGFTDMRDFRDELVDRRFELLDGDLNSFTDSDLAGCIRNYVNYIVNNYRMDQVKEAIQIGCARLAEWIDTTSENDPEKVKRFFPEYYSEEGRAKLLTSKAVAAISKELRKLKEEMDSLRDAMQRNNYGEDYYMEEDGDVFFSEEDLRNYDGTKEDFAREVGDAGEEFTYKLLKEYFEENLDFEIAGLKGYTFLNRHYEVVRMDTEDYKQPGYDIELKIYDNVKEVISIDYFEVKTHTTNSSNRKRLTLSEEQMKMALLHGAHYHVVKVSYDANARKCTDIEVFQNLCEKVISGELRHTTHGYSYTA